MSDSTLFNYLGELDTAALAAYTPSPPTPASGPDPLYLIRNTDDNTLYYWTGAAWATISGAGPTAITALTGDVTATGPGSVAATIAANAVTNTKIRDSIALSVIGRSANSTGDPADISTAAASGAVLRESGSTVGFGTIATAGVANDAITFAKMQNIATDSLIGRDTAGTGDPENILLNATLSMDGAGNLRREALTGDVTASAGSNATTIANNAVVTAKILDSNVTTAKIADDNVTYAKIQDISATQRVLGRNTAAAGDTEEVTFTQFMDWVSASAAQGDIIYRNGTTWVRLAAGTNGFVLTTGGAGANPAWAASSGGGADPAFSFLLMGC